MYNYWCYTVFYTSSKAENIIYTIMFFTDTTPSYSSIDNTKAIIMEKNLTDALKVLLQWPSSNKTLKLTVLQTIVDNFKATINLYKTSTSSKGSRHKHTTELLRYQSNNTCAQYTTTWKYWGYYTSKGGYSHNGRFTSEVGNTPTHSTRPPSTPNISTLHHETYLPTPTPHTHQYQTHYS